MADDSRSDTPAANIKDVEHQSMRDQTPSAQPRPAFTQSGRTPEEGGIAGGEIHRERTRRRDNGHSSQDQDSYGSLQ